MGYSGYICIIQLAVQLADFQGLHSSLPDGSDVHPQKCFFFHFFPDIIENGERYHAPHTFLFFTKTMTFYCAYNNNNFAHLFLRKVGKSLVQWFNFIRSARVGSNH